MGIDAVMAAIEACRTAQLGGHSESCGDCGLVRIAYNSCRNRHCPKCQGLARAQWLADRQTELLPVPYFHVVFTVPAEIGAIAFHNKAAIANSRLVEIVDGSVRFRWKDYRHHDKQKVMTLEAGEFIRRFLLHVLPDGFHRIRHYGFLANGRRATKLEACRRLLAVPVTPPVEVATAPDDYRDRHRRLTGHDLRRCPCCGGTMAPLSAIPRSPAGQGAYRIDTS